VLSSLDTETGTVRELLRSDVQLGLPVGSPDGQRAAIVQAISSDRGIVAGDLTVIDLDSGASATLATADTDVTQLQWIDSSRLGYLGLRHLQSVAGIVSTSGPAIEVFATDVSCGGRYPDGSFLADGRVVVTESAYDLPPRVTLREGAGDKVLASTAHPGTDYLRSIAGTAETVTWTAPDGLEIEGVLCHPDGDGPFPLIVHVHGGPVSAWRDMWSMRFVWVPLLVARGYAVLHPNPRGSSGRGQAFARLVYGDPGGADAHDHLSGIDALVDRGIADPARIGLIGGSYGGFMTSWLITQDQRFAAAVPYAPVTDWYSKVFTSNIGRWNRSMLGADPEQPGTVFQTRSPVLHASKVRTPCLNVAGGLDLCTPPDQAREFHQALQSYGAAESVLATYPTEGHGVRSYPAMTDFLTRTLTWFTNHMPASP
jgi:dipeptidyl aminopeptidase/acylaminoacyl peptidase